ncbi:hypothetical protein [Pseudomonas sp. CGJS7]|uniref:hypothetical protein n=1 Tax=Pseudomonas sp. CGJS7 TaxID=3109348 RepID=UPI00300B2FF8
MVESGFGGSDFKARHALLVRVSASAGVTGCGGLEPSRLDRGAMLLSVIPAKAGIQGFLAAWL